MDFFRFCQTQHIIIILPSQHSEWTFSEVISQEPLYRLHNLPCVLSSHEEIFYQYRTMTFFRAVN